MKQILMMSLLVLLSLATATYADVGDMMSTWGMAGFGFIGLFYLIIVFFIFSAVFWLTYRWIVTDDRLVDKKTKK